MEFTGERYVGNLDIAQISYEHWHRYFYAKNFVKDKKVLDIACGEGYGSFLLSETALQVIGVDISEDAVNHARITYQNPNLEYVTGSATDIPVTGNGIFDVIVSYETIEHVNSEDQVKFLNEVKRLLKPDGLFIVSTPDKLLYSDLKNYKNEFHLKEFYKEEFREFLQGFFSNVVLCGQQVFTGSVVLSPGHEKIGSGSIHLMKFDGKRFIQEKSHNDTVFLIALCSESEIIPESSVLADTSLRLVDEKDEMYAREIQRVHEYYQGKVATLYGFLGDQVISSYFADIPESQFKVTFKVNTLDRIDSLRFDPAENRTCKLKIDELAVKSESGITRIVPPDKLHSNGKRKSDGYFYFNTLDPQITIPVTDVVSEVIIRGEIILGPTDLKDVWKILQENEEFYLNEISRVHEYYRGKIATLYAFVDDEAVASFHADVKENEFQLTYDLSHLDRVDYVRFDPAEDRICKLKIESIVQKDRNGRKEAVPLDTVITNGRKRADGTIQFNTLDPKVRIPVCKEVTEVYIKGERFLEPFEMLDLWVKFRFGIIKKLFAVYRFYKLRKLK